MLKKLISLFFFIICFTAHSQNAGDTITIQTFDYSSTTRDTMINFPNNSLTYEKIIMSYNMRCKDDVVNTSGSINNIGCGAWDYSCHTNIHDSSRIDSIRAKTASHLISNFSGNVYPYSISPIYNYYQFYQQNTIINNIINEDTINSGNGTQQLNYVISSDQKSNKSQFVFLASELNSLGLINDSIHGISLNSISTSNVNFFKIKLKLSTDSTLDATTPHNSGFTEVFHSNVSIVPGENRFQFHTPFMWDGVSNLIIEFSSTNSITSVPTAILGDSLNYSCGLYSNDASNININQAEHINIPHNPLNSINNEITVSFWVFGDENTLPYNSTILEGLDGNGSRTLNIHFPWSNSRVYWDCGNNAGSYDRIDKLAAQNEFSSKWNHWVFTKNSISGEMKMYINGVLWHSGSNKNALIDIQELTLGSNGKGTGYFWDGKIKEMRIFNKELSQSTISNWMNIRLNNNHPNYSDLVAYYPFNEGAGSIANDNSINNSIATFNGNVIWENSRGENISQFFNATNFRPNISLFQGSYSITSTTSVVLDSLLAPPNTVEERSIYSNYNSLNHDSIAIVSSNTFWHAVSYTYDTSGAIISSDTLAIDSTINIGELIYYNRYPMAFQIMSFVTPYGAYLDLGTYGKTWYFDVTDFAPILKGLKRMNMTSGGQWQEDMDIKFHFIVGTPSRDVVNIQQVWRPQSRGYNSILNENSFEPRDVYLNPNAVSYKLRTVITGHGQEGEFIPRDHYLNINGGNIEYTWPVWTECAANPIYPQGGTWIYDRAGWCPGQASDIREDDITALVTPGQIHNIDYGVTNASGTSNYWVSSQLVSYKAPNHNLDASVIDIISPTNKVKFSRINPTCGRPKIIIKNTGATTLTSLKIEYWVNNSTTKEVQIWNGTLDFQKQDTIELNAPYNIWDNLLSSNNKFYVEISEPNLSNDENIYNNYIHSTFDPVPSYDNTFALWLQTNSGSIGLNQSETSWDIYDRDNNLVYESAGGGALTINSQYRDTLVFDDGCYTFLMNDTDDDGIDFWANNDGAGMARFRKLGASWIKIFEGDFGKFIHHEFQVNNNTTSIDENVDTWAFYPNPSKNQVTIKGVSNGITDLILLDSLGKQLKKITFEINGKFQKKIDLSYLEDGIYMIKVITNTEEILKKVVKI